MKHYEEIVVPPKPQTTQKKFKSGSCDICGKETKREDDIEDTLNWSKGTYQSNMVQIFHETKTNYPDGGGSEKEYFEICPDCFDNKVKPFLESLGAKLYNSENDW